MYENGNMSPADMAAVVGNNNDGFGFGGNGAWWVFILFLFAMNNGWGNGFGGNGAGAGMQRGFDQQAVMSGIGDISGAIGNGFANVQTALCNGFAGVNAGMASGFAQAEIASNGRQMANMNQLFGIQTNLDSRLDSMAMAQQTAACENRAAVADVKYAVATEAANTRNNCNGNYQKVMDKLCQMEMDTMRQNYEGQLRAMQTQLDAARTEIQGLKDNVARTADRAAIIANNEAQTNALERYLAPNPIPAFLVQNPNCCPNQGYGWGGCGCGRAA